MRDRTDEVLRESLSSLPRPRASTVLATAVLTRLAERPRRPERAERAAARLALVLYWLAAGSACAWMLRGLPWPAWTAPSLWPAALAVPIVAAVLLGLRRVTGIAAWCLRLLLADPRS